MLQPLLWLNMTANNCLKSWQMHSPFLPPFAVCSLSNPASLASAILCTSSSSQRSALASFLHTSTSHRSSSRTFILRPPLPLSDVSFNPGQTIHSTTLHHPPHLPIFTTSSIAFRLSKHKCSTLPARHCHLQVLHSFFFTAISSIQSSEAATPRTFKTSSAAGR
ncbi:hypothetical protein K402DRAFT_162718 [Aulographum hederae CBS 113979]|uniref:Uncharacterized protein n=1 Tax=Aulographum hederae CBS 113979 TaxID=1176131 RepID=A0A6G1GRW0_9PEZI|nr:hypothetical protein K402DRAFT_162718 [Aulographum hederae CBS 113979]